MNVKIITAVSCMFIFTFSLLILSEQIMGNDAWGKEIDEMVENSEFFINDFSKNRTVFLIGASHVGHINVTKVNEIIKLEISNSETPITVYNLAFPGNNPIRELSHVELITSSNPEIIFYGVSYRDFKFPINEDVKDSPLPDIKSMTSEALFSSAYDLVPSNPQLLTRVALKEIFQDESEVEQINPTEIIPKTPFFKYFKNPVIKSDDEIKREVKGPTNWKDSVNQYGNIKALHEYIQRLKDNNIEIVIFLVPLHQYYLESLSDSQKRSLSNLVDDFKTKYGIKVYDFREKYVGLDIWHDSSHISYHSSVTQYNNDIANMIIFESQR